MTHVNELRFQTNPYSNMQNTPKSTGPIPCTPESPSRSATESPSHSASKILFTELDVLCDILRDSETQRLRDSETQRLRDSETKTEERLAPILHPRPQDAAGSVHPDASDFSPLFHELFIGIRAAQAIAVRNHDLIDRVDNL